MTIDEYISRCEKLASNYEFNLKMNQNNIMLLSVNDIERMKEFKAEYEQLAEWLKELKKYRAIFEKIGRILHENGYTIDDLDTIFGKVNDEEVNADDERGNNT